MQITNSDISQACEWYFSQFAKIVNIRENDAKTNAIAIAVLLSAATVVIPVGILAIYGATMLYRGPREELSARDRLVDNMARRRFETIDLSMLAENVRLAEAIETKYLSQHSHDTFNEVHRVVATLGFVQGPRYHMTLELIDRGVDYARTDDGVRQFIIGEIPEFTEYLRVPSNLERTGANLFHNADNREAIMRVLNASLRDVEFTNYFNAALNNLDTAIRNKTGLAEAEHDLRIALNVFNQARLQQHFHLTPIAESAEV